MARTLLERLSAQLQASGAQQHADALVVALSGGLDSVTLLGALQRLSLRIPLRCIHIDHGLHEDSQAWSQFCVELCTAAGIDCQIVPVQLDDTHAQGLEAAARHARYRAFAQHLRTGEWLLSAHHADDQLETLLYRMLRGTGVAGLQGVRRRTQMGEHVHLRAFADITREEIRAQAQEWGLQWREDPSNADERFDRNFLRARVLPVVRARWPAAAAAATRLADAAADAAQILEAQAQADRGTLSADAPLPVALLRALSAARQRNLLRSEIANAALPVPDAAALERIRALADAANDASAVQWPGGEARIWHEAVYLLAACRPLPDGPLPLSPDMPCAVGGSRIQLESAPHGLPDALVRDGLFVRFRRGGERFTPAGKRRSMPLSEWMRDNGVLPWMRDRIPLIYAGDELAAVADLALDARAAQSAAGGWRVAWHDRPRTH